MPQHQQQQVLPWDPRAAHAHWERLALRHQRRCKGAAQSHDSLTYVKYGAGIAAGIAVVGWLKRKLQDLPLVGVVATPFLSLMPAVLVGTAVGAAVVYTLDEGPQAIQKKVLPKVKQHLQAAQRDAAAVAADLQQGVRELQGQSNGALQELTATLDAAAAEAEASPAPLARRQAAAAQKQLQQLERHLTAAEQQLEKQQPQQQQRRQQQRFLPSAGGRGGLRALLGGGGSSDTGSE